MVGTEPLLGGDSGASSKSPRALWARIPLSIQVAFLTGGVVGGQGLTALLTAKWLGASDRGVIAVAQTVSMLLVMFGGLGLVQGTRVLLADPARGVTLKAYTRASWWLVGLQLVAAATVGVFAFMRLADVRDLALIGSFVVLTAALFRTSLLREALHGVGWHRSAVVSEAMAAVVPLAIIAVGYATGHLTLLFAFAALVIGALSQWGLQAWAIRRAMAGDPANVVRGSEFSFVLVKRMVVFSLPGLVGALGLALAGRMDRLVLAMFHDTATVGVYATASTLADLPWVLPMSISPIIVRSVARSQSTQIHRIWWLRVMSATVVLSLVTMAVGWWVMERFLGTDFHGNALLLAVLLVGALGIASQQVDLAVCTGLGDLAASARSATWGAVLGTVAFLALIPPFGAMGAALGTVVTYLSMAVVARLRLRRHTSEGSTT